MLRIDFWNILWTVVNLLVLYLLMKKFLFGRVIQVMEQRKALIDSQFASAGEAEKKALDMNAQYEKSLSEAKETSVKILDQAKADGQAEYQRIVDEAGAQAGQMIAKAHPQKRADRRLPPGDGAGGAVWIPAHRRRV